MKDDYTHITIIMDRTGSMSSVKSDAEGAINHFISEQQKVDGECSLLFVDFDSTEPFHTVHDGPIAAMGKYRLEPRDSTPLLYAVGTGITRTGERLANMAEEDRPSKVIFVIQTDGLENFSTQMPEHPYTWEHVREMIKTQQDDYAWQIIFLGQGQDSWDQGSRLGVNLITQSAGTGQAHHSTHSVMSHYATDYRMGQTADMSRAKGMTVNSVGAVYDEQGQEIDPKTGKPKVDTQA